MPSPLASLFGTEFSTASLEPSPSESMMLIAMVATAGGETLPASSVSVKATVRSATVGSSNRLLY